MPKITKHNSQTSAHFNPPEPAKRDSVPTFLSEIRIRACHIYEDVDSVAVTGANPLDPNSRIRPTPPPEAQR